MSDLDEVFDEVYRSTGGDFDRAWEQSMKVADAQALEEAEESRGFRLASAGTAAARSWILTNIVPTGTVTTLIGQEGQGKTTFAKTLLADLTLGSIPGDFQGMPQAGIIVSFEEDDDSDIKPALEFAGGDLSKVAILDEESRGIWTGDWLEERLEAVEAAVGLPVRLIVLDGVKDFMGDAASDNNTKDVRKFLQPLNKLAKRRDLAIIAVAHPNLSNPNRVSGNRAWQEVPRQVLTYTSELISVVKSNYGKRGQELRIKGVRGTVAGSRGEEIEAWRTKYKSEAGMSYSQARGSWGSRGKLVSPMTGRTCGQCQGSLVGMRANAKFCSPVCKQRAYDRRHP